MGNFTGNRAPSPSFVNGQPANQGLPGGAQRNTFAGGNQSPVPNQMQNSGMC